MSWEQFIETASEHFWIAVAAFFGASAAFWKFCLSYMNRKVEYEREDGAKYQASFKPQQASLIEGLVRDLRGCTERHAKCQSDNEILREQFFAHLRLTGHMTDIVKHTRKESRQDG